MEVQANEKKVALRKVRTSFLHRTPQDNENESEVRENRIIRPFIVIIDPRFEYLPKGEPLPLQPPLSLIEYDRKLYSGYCLRNIWQRVSNVAVQIHLQKKIITLSLENHRNYYFKPWQYIVKRLESYGDLEFAEWAKRIKNYNENYKKTMENYLSLFRDENSDAVIELKKIQRITISKRQEIESKSDSFLRATSFASKDSIQTLSFTYTENFLSGMGFTIDTLAEWIKTNGIPGLSAKDSPGNLKLSALFLESPFHGNQCFWELPESKKLIAQKDGTKKEMIVSAVNIIEPSSEGLFLHTYHFMRSNANESLNESRRNDLGTTGKVMLKSYKIC